MTLLEIVEYWYTRSVHVLQVAQADAANFLHKQVVYVFLNPMQKSRMWVETL